MNRFFKRAYFGTDVAAIRRNKFAARYFWFKAKLSKRNSFLIVLALLGRQKSADFNFEPEIIGRFSGAGPLNSYVTSTLKMIYLGKLIEPV